MTSDDESAKKSEGDEALKNSKQESGQAQDASEKNQKQFGKTSYHSGLTGHFGKAIVESSDTLERRNEDIASSYQQLKKKKNFALSAISSTFGDLLGGSGSYDKPSGKQDESSKSEDASDKESSKKSDKDLASDKNESENSGSA